MTRSVKGKNMYSPERTRRAIDQQNTLTCLVVFLLLLIVLPLVVFIQVGCLYLAWNVVMPPLFGLSTITMWQSLGIIVLLDIISGVLKVRVKKEK